MEIARSSSPLSTNRSSACGTLPLATSRLARPRADLRAANEPRPAPAQPPAQRRCHAPLATQVLRPSFARARASTVPNREAPAPARVRTHTPPNASLPPRTDEARLLDPRPPRPTRLELRPVHGLPGRPSSECCPRAYAPNPALLLRGRRRRARPGNALDGNRKCLESPARPRRRSRRQLQGFRVPVRLVRPRRAPEPGPARREHHVRAARTPQRE